MGRMEGRGAKIASFTWLFFFILFLSLQLLPKVDSMDLPLSVIGRPKRPLRNPRALTYILSITRVEARGGFDRQRAIITGTQVAAYLCSTILDRTNEFGQKRVKSQYCC